MKLFNGLTISMLGAMVATITPSVAETAGKYADPETLPKYGLGLGVGYEAGEINDFDYDGTMVHGRAVKLFWTYPILMAGVDVKYLDITLDGVSGEVDATGYSIGPVFGGMIPLEFFMDMPVGMPKGAGIIVYSRYTFIDDLEFDDADNIELNGESWTVGGQIPLPIQAGGLLYNI